MKFIGLMAVLLLGVALSIVAAKDEPASGQAEMRVGIDDGDIRGDDQRALQAAVDQVARLGGGTVHIGAGRYTMRNALVLRDNVAIKGVPGKTVLAAGAGVKVRLASDGDCNEKQITLSDPSAFRVGDGVSIQDDRFRGGFTITTATLMSRVDDKTFRISTPLYMDYMIHLNATAKLAFPIVSGVNVKNVSLDGLTIDGNRAKTEFLDGCRGGGIYLFQSDTVSIRNCVVRGYNGDGISFQVSNRVTIEDCLCENNAWIGLHPGSGSQSPVLRRNRSVKNGNDGLFICWRVKHGLFENNQVQDNGGVGLSIGHKDTDNLFRGNAITGNAKVGIFFREESEPMGAHRNVFEGNRIVDNGLALEGEKACIVILGHHHDVVFRKNVIGTTKPDGIDIGIAASAHTPGLLSEDNQFLHVKTEVRKK